MLKPGAVIYERLPINLASSQLLQCFEIESEVVKPATLVNSSNLNTLQFDTLDICSRRPGHSSGLENHIL